MPGLVVPVLIALATVTALVLSLRRDPRWTGNAFLLSAAVLAVVSALMALRTGPGASMSALVVALIVLSPLLVGALVVFLLLNGLQMIRKEGRSLGNLLSLLAGLGIVGVLALLVVSIPWLTTTRWVLPLDMLLVLACCWVGFVFASYLLYTVVYPRLPRRSSVRYVMVHGSGLIRGKVPPLLRSRVDTGIRLWRAALQEDPTARLILSGGKGDDEPRSEASAMAEHAEQQGVPASAILLEDRSATTEENLRFGRDLVRRELGPDATGVTVTSSYHVLRTAALARRVGIDAQVLPAPTAGYFWPSAFLREFVALVVNHRIAHAIVAALVILPLPILLAIALGN